MFFILVILNVHHLGSLLIQMFNLGSDSLGFPLDKQALSHDNLTFLQVLSMSIILLYDQFYLILELKIHMFSVFHEMSSQIF